MKAVILHGKEQVTLGEFPTPALNHGEVRVSVAYCGICGSDHHKVAGKKNTHAIHYPVPLGHEISGVVAEIGEGVTEFKVGDRVTVDPNWSCGKCRFCKEGKPSFCEHARGVVKGMAEYVVSPEESVYHLPDTLDLRSAALAEPLACCLHGMDLLGVRHGDAVALVGFGAIGKIMLQLIRLAGAGEIAVIETDMSKRALAMEMGATYFASPLDADAMQKLTETAHFSRVIECVGVRPAQQTALADQNLLDRRNLHKRNFHAQVTAGDHHAAAHGADVLHIVHTGTVFDLGNDLNIGAAVVIQQFPDIQHILLGTHK